MYYLKSKDGAKAFYLFENQEYIVGRKDCNILIANDTSISRKHASILVKEKGRIELVDFGSKYKTFLNNLQLEQHVQTELKVNDEIKFGILHSVYGIQEYKMNITSSGLTADDKKKLSSIMSEIGGNILPNWSKECTHLTIVEIMLTLKILSALIEGNPMVTMNFWKDFLVNVTRNLPPPNPENYQPIYSEVMVNKNINFKYLPRRRTLFKDKIFVFRTKASKSKIESVVELAGGKCVRWNEKELTNQHFISNNPKYLLIQDDSIPPIVGNNSFQDMITYLHSIGKRPIPFQEIAMAIVLASCEKDCNADYKKTVSAKHVPQIIYTQKPANTQNHTETQEYELEDKESIIIPETLLPNIQCGSSVKRSGELLGNDVKKIRLATKPSTNEVVVDGPSTSFQSRQNNSAQMSQENSELLDIKPLEDIDEILNTKEAIELYKTQAAKKQSKQSGNNSRKAVNAEPISRDIYSFSLSKTAASPEIIDLDADIVPSKQEESSSGLKRGQKEIQKDNNKRMKVENEKDASKSLRDPDIVTSTQIDNDFVPQPSTSKDVKQTSSNFQGFIRCAPKENKNKQTTKSSEFFKPFEKSKQANDNIVPNISAIFPATPSASGIKRRADISPDRHINASHMVKNPFKRPEKTKSQEKTGNLYPFGKMPKTSVKSNTTDSANPFSNTPTTIVKKKQDTVKNVNPELSEPYRISVTAIDVETEKSYRWLSKNTIIKEEVNCSSNKNLSEVDEQMQKFAESFNNCMIIEMEKLVVRREVPSKNNETTFTNKKNFKKFKKIQPCHVQTTIIGRNSFIDVVCQPPNIV